MSLKENYRNLTGYEIEVLELNGCSCDDWNRVCVKDGFDPFRCINVIFSGDIRLGVFIESFIDESVVSDSLDCINIKRSVFIGIRA